MTPASAGVSPPRKINYARRGGRLYPLAIYGEGVAYRPGVRSNEPRVRSNEPRVRSNRPGERSKASARDQNLQKRKKAKTEQF